MSSFKHVVKNYENLAKLGRQIIQHKKDIKHIKPHKIDEAFLTQEFKIQQFFDDAFKLRDTGILLKNVIFTMASIQF